MFADVIAARVLRAQIVAFPDQFAYPEHPVCPVCSSPVTNHIGQLPCWVRNEMDRYGLHHPSVRPTLTIPQATGYTGPCVHCSRALVTAPDDHCPDCIFVPGVSEPEWCICPDEYKL